MDDDIQQLLNLGLKVVFLDAHNSLPLGRKKKGARQDMASRQVLQRVKNLNFPKKNRIFMLAGGDAGFLIRASHKTSGTNNIKIWQQKL
jgi:hypothetical protein